MTRTHRLAALILAGLLSGMLLLTGCGKPAPTNLVKVTIAGKTTTIPATMQCKNGQPELAPNSAALAPLQVPAGQRMTFTVSSDIATKSWTIVVYSASMSSGSLLPNGELSSVSVGNKTTFSGMTTSDAVSNQLYIAIETPPETGCTDAGGIWSFGMLRVAS